MSISDALLPEFDQEVASTRKALERIPEAHLDFAPHEKSMNLGDLATHLANLPGWVADTLNKDAYDIDPPDGAAAPQPPRITSTAEAVSTFDAKAAEARAAIGASSDATFMSPWSLKKGGAVQFTMPKVAVLRSFILNHMIHHRAQLGIYLRMNDVPVPSSYGPTADEQM
jgi:uncharacterized damage-inducible protein DinB